MLRFTFAIILTGALAATAAPAFALDGPKVGPVLGPQPQAVDSFLFFNPQPPKPQPKGK